MIFNKFVRACKKYKFTFALSTYGGLTLILRPNRSFENIEVKGSIFRVLFLRAIVEMKRYRKEVGY